MKSEKGAIKLIALLGVIVLIVVAFGIVIGFKMINKEENAKVEDNKLGNNNVIDDEKSEEKNDDWKKIKIGKNYAESTTIQIDLDGDNKKDEIKINESGKYISINEKDYISNKYYNEEDKRFDFIQYGNNQYHFVDINKDGIIEIIHETTSGMISPPTNEYTIYNYKDNSLKEIGNFSMIGKIPDEIYVKKNTIKFEYHPYESKAGYTSEVTCNLLFEEDIIYSTVYYFEMGSRKVRIYESGDVYDDLEIENPYHIPEFKFVKTLSKKELERFKYKA